MSDAMDEIRVVELSMMDKSRYYPLTVASGMAIRGLLYPFGLIKTRLQIQTGHQVYKGTFDAYVKIFRSEGFLGLYRGFWVYNLQVVSSLFYINTYEHVRHGLALHTSIKDSSTRGLIAGGMAGAVGQTITVPIDIVTQHMMLLGQQKDDRHTSGKHKNEQVKQKLKSLQEIHVPEELKHKRFGPFISIVSQLYRKNGLLGFYKGYFLSICTFVPNSALWWLFYDKISHKMVQYAPDWTPRLFLQCISGPLAGVCSAVITNPMDVIRAQVQVKGGYAVATATRLWKEEGYKMCVKGLSARLVQSVMFSFFIILGYESIKRLSLLPEYKDRVRW